jgi:putative pyruvate formate lyase activating enzyme
MIVFDRFVPERVWRRLRPDAVTVWDDERVKRALSWYYLVMTDQAPAKFMLSRLLEFPEDPSRLDVGSIIEEKRRLRSELEAMRRKALEGGYSLEEYMRDARSLPEHSLLEATAVLAEKLVSPCILCERRCRIDRRERIGACRLDHRTYVHSWFHHLGEEAPLVPSGTIFYGGCNFSCVYCQNYDISQVAPRSGEVVDARRLAEMQKLLRLYGARNINHVGGEPTPSLHTIARSLLYLDVNVPQLWNSNMYMSIEAMEVLIDIIDIWLPDFKYGNDRCALRLSAVPRYTEVVKRNLLIAARYGDMIIRHLVLPNHVECCSIPIMQWIATNLPKERILVNIMDQYRPEHLVAKYPRRWREIARPVTSEEVWRVRREADKLGIIYDPVS